MNFNDMTTSEKIALLRKEMELNNIDTFIVFSADPHMNEYLPEKWKEREWISGFTGSAGFVVITKQDAGLWTDGRYFTQAPIELKESGIQLFKDGIEGTPNYIDWIISQTKENAHIAVNSLATSHANWETLKLKLTTNKRRLVHAELLNTVWSNRPEASQNPIFAHPLKWAGVSLEAKIKAIQAKMNQLHVTIHIVASLDNIAWTLNLRGSDVECNPVFISYLLIQNNQTILFVDDARLTDEARNQLSQAKVELKSYNLFFDYLKTLKNESILIDPTSNQAIFETLQVENNIVQAPTISHLMKAQKNDVELEGFRKVMVRDGVAMVKFLYWLTQNVGKEVMDEFTVGEKLLSFRNQGEHFVGQSFGSIVGYQGNGAIIHYSAKKENCASIHKIGSILIDSGGQYLEGTTDITRTFPLGEVSDEFMHDSTLVLKGHIQLSMMKFPKGTKGVQLDTLARQALWMEGKEYNHGTGHGVGSFLNVHEGPQNIRKDMNAQDLMLGMVVSNEPGYYLENKYGIRHENLIAVRPWKTTQWNDFYEFETLTWCPYFTNSIKKELLNEEEIAWINEYHEQCKEKLAPHLTDEVKAWFLEMIKPI